MKKLMFALAASGFAAWAGEPVESNVIAFDSCVSTRSGAVAAEFDSKFSTFAVSTPLPVFSSEPIGLYLIIR